MRVALLTSSRADYGIYRPLISRLVADEFFNLKIFAFGTHLSKNHGYTLDEIKRDGYQVDREIHSLLMNDDEAGIATSAAITSLKFADVWNEEKDKLDIVICLGDRFEMFSAVMAGIPYGIRFAHIHGGESTLGAIDNIYRHSISLASNVHFVSIEQYKNRLIQILGEEENIHVTGSLSLDNLDGIELSDQDSFMKEWNIDLNIPSVLLTFHPETMGSKIEDQVKCIDEIMNYLADKFQLVITMPNADTNGLEIRKIYDKYKDSDRVHLVENFGTQGYFSCMNHVKFIIGNSSSGIIEAASLNKYVIDVGARQKGRITGKNVHHVEMDSEKVKRTIEKVIRLGTFDGENIYGSGNASKLIISELKKLEGV